MWKYRFKGQNVRRIDGTYDGTFGGTDRTCPWDRRDPHQGVSRQNSLRSLVFFFLGERQSIARKGVRAIDARKSAPRNVANAAKTSVRAPGLSTDELSGLPNANAKSQRFSYAVSQIAPLPPVVALNRSFKSQIAARYGAFWRAVSQIALTSFL